MEVAAIKENGFIEETMPKTPINRTLEKVFLESNQALVITDLDGTVLRVNPKHREVSGYEPGDVVGQNPRMMKSGVHDKSFYDNMWREITETGRWEGEIWDRRKDGELYAKWLLITTVPDEQGSPCCYLGLFHDVTKAKQDLARLEYLAHYDAVTKLPNRILFIDRVKQAISRSKRSGMHVAQMFVDLDGFKQVNDQYGHRAGDKLLYQVAERLRSTVRDADTVARLGGDEFTVVVPDIKMEIDATTIADKLVKSVRKSFSIEGVEISVSASIGIALYPFDGETVDDLLKNSDLAMYAAKQAGKDQFQLFKAEMGASD
jgi:diguanylate cyclase (GGDEF)-like protein/PAS domain S-box-containing protein